VGEELSSYYLELSTFQTSDFIKHDQTEIPLYTCSRNLHADRQTTS
jgi:hypothetical protein